MKFGPLLGSVCVALALGLPAAAQDSSNLSADELREIFQKQKTRGLIITPGTEATAPEAGAETTTTDVAAAEPALVDLPADEQVNIQIRFDFDSAALKDEEKPKLVALCEAMKSVDVQLFRIVGHTDSSGSDEYNQRLSLLRAEEVKRHLVSECGIDGARLEAVGAGEARPVDADDPRADANRRVEFQALS
jgi:OOP family OmpA-OmpF porin